MIQFILRKINTISTRTIIRIGSLFLSRSFHSFSTLIFSFIAGRLLTIEEHGLYSQYLARIIVFQAILEIGLQYSVIRYLSPFIKKNNQVEIQNILRSSMIIKFFSIFLVFLISILWIVENFLFSYWNIYSNIFPLVPPPGQIINVWLVFLSSIGMSFFSYFDSLLVSYKKYKTLILWIPITGITRIMILLIFFFLNDGALQINHVLFSFMIGTFLSWPFYFLSFDSRQFFSPVNKIKVYYWIRKLLKYNLWIVLASFFAILSDWMEILMIKNQVDAGIFNAARIPMQGIAILLTTMQSFIIPAMSHFTQPDEYKQYFIKIYKYIFILILILAPMILILNWFIILWFGQEYYQSTAVLWIIFPGFLLRIVFAPLGTALFTLDQPVMIAIEAGLRMIGSIILNLILIPEFGVMGAAYSSLFSQFFGWIFLIYLFYYYFKFNKFPFQSKKIKPKI